MNPVLFKAIVKYSLLIYRQNCMSFIRLCRGDVKKQRRFKNRIIKVKKLCSFVELIGGEAVCAVAKTSHFSRLTSTLSVCRRNQAIFEKKLTSSVLDKNVSN